MTQRRPGFLTRYAKHAGITVRTAAGQLQRVGINYHAQFDFADADRRREAWLRADEALVAQGYASEADADIGTFVGETVGPLGKAQAHERHFKARLAELEFLERVGTVVDKQQVETEAFRIARQVRDALLTIPDRLAGVIAAESDGTKIRDLLVKEINLALTALAEAPRS